MAKSEHFRLVIDTNLWISFIISNKLQYLDELLRSSHITLLFSTELLDEIRRTASKPKLKIFFPSGTVEEMLDVIEPFSEMVEVESVVNECRDPNDNFLLALAKDGNADFLITGDKDLLSIKQFEHTKIITFSDLIEIVKKD